jgi:ATP-dependent DNA helicase RecG
MLFTNIENLPGTSIMTIRKMRSLGIKTYWDLINYFPFRYEDYSIISSIDKAQVGERVTIKGQIQDIKNSYTRRGLNIQSVTLFDGTDTIRLSWFNQYYLMRLFQEKGYISVSGDIKIRGRRKEMYPREFELLKTLEQTTLHTGRLVPIYPEKRGLSSKTLREKLFFILNNIDFSDIEIFQNSIRAKYDLIEEHKAYENIHFPSNNFDLKKAIDRLSFDELFVLQLASQIIRNEWKKEKTGFQFEYKKFEKEILNFVKNLPFKLTSDQKKSIDEIIKDLSSLSPMNRLLQGDVGSGKTIVAAVSCYLSCLNKYQSIIMAPTEILAKQHFQTFSALFIKQKNKINISLITGSIKNKRELLSKSDIVIGTHALLGEKINYKKIGFIVIDEQQRFGVLQRSQLKLKGSNPHLLTMTATPIPRTAALTIYGELDLSQINEMPKGKAQTKSYFVPKKKRSDMYKWIENKVINEKIQVFIICPLIEESEHETMKNIKAAIKEYENLKNKMFPDLKIALLHGKMKSKEKDEVMNDFKKNNINILVSTPVVEVGIDFPNATIMVIEAAERYGLAQLHQLRGRVGRGVIESYCLLFSEKENPKIISRLNYFSKNNNGAKIAEYDLQHRGPGEIFGTRQHGLFELRIANLNDFNLIKKTKEVVDLFLNKKGTSFTLQLKKRLELLSLNKISRD